MARGHLKGVFPALLTPFDQKGEIDESSLRRLIRFNLDQGVDGLYVGGSTAETFLQDAAERTRILEIVAQEAQGKSALIAHVGGIATADSQRLAETAHRLGYDAVSAVTPFYYPFTFEEHCAHYRAIIEAAGGTPMVVYNIPAMSGVRLSLGQIGQLMGLPGVIALKQTSGDLYQMEQIRRAHPDRILYNGYDEIFLSGQMAGANGGIGSTYNVMGWRYRAILMALAAGDMDEARRLQAACNRVIDLLIAAGVFQGLKTILCEMGVIASATCRKPFAGVRGEHLPALRVAADRLSSELQDVRGAAPPP